MSSQKKKKHLTKNYLLNVNSYNETKNNYLLDKVLLDESEKQKMGLGYKIYTDGTIEFFAKPKNNRLTISNELRKWFNLPKNENASLILLADFYYMNSSNEIVKVENVEIKLFYKELDKISKYNGVYIIPLGDSLESGLIREQMKTRNTLYCKVNLIQNTNNKITPTNYFLESVKTHLKTSTEIKQENLELIVAGEKRSSRFEIYRDLNGKILVKLRKRMRFDGTIEFPMGLSDYIENWYENEEYIKCSLNKQKPVIKQAKTRMLGSFPLKLIRFSYYGEPKEVELDLMSDKWKLTDKALTDYKIIKLLKSAGFKIDMIRTGIPYTKTHYNQELEKQLREILETACENNEDILIFQEVEITTNHILGENALGDKSIVDVLILLRNRITKDVKLFLIELKTSVSKGRSVIIKDKLGEQLHTKSKLREDNRIIPILLHPIKFTTDNNKKMAKSLSILLLNGDDLKEILVNPKSLFSKVDQFQKNRLDQKNELVKQLDSCKIAERDDLKLLLKHKKLVEKTFPVDVSIIGINKIERKGSAFEREIQKELEKEGYEVQRNVEMIYFGKLFEIDLLAIKDDEILFVECRDGSKLSKLKDINKQIRTKIALTELNMKLFKAHKARVYVKLEKLVDEMQGKYGKIEWIKNLKVIISKN